MAVTTALAYESNPTRTLAFSVDNGDGSKVPVYGRDLRNSPAVKLTSATPNNQQGGADLSLHEILTVPVGAPVTIDLQAFVDVAQRTARSFARVKTVEFWLLGSDDAALGGNACTGLTVEPGAANGFLGFLAAVGDKLVLGNGDRVEISTRRAAGWVVDATHKTLTLTDTDGAINAVVLVIINGGSN
jgi:hypothetical protein